MLSTTNISEYLHAPYRDDILHCVQGACALRSLSLAQTTEELVKVKRLRNAVVPINILPAELLVEIFTHLIDVERKNVALIRATSVCKLWHTIALNVAKLWTAFPINNLVATKQFLRRSRALPIALSLSTFDCSLQPLAGLIGPHVHRIRSLRLSGSQTWRLRHLLSRIRIAAPKLEELSVEQYSPPDPFPRHSHPLFNGVVPSLRKLITINVNLSVQLPDSSALVHLVIRNNRDLASKRLLDLLACCPLLETFELSGYPAFDPDTVTDSRIITLSCLKLLQLDIVSSSRTAAFLHYLSVPRSAQLRISTQDERRLGEAAEAYTMLPRHAQARLKCLVGIRRMEFLFDQKLSTITLRAYRDSEAFLEPDVQIDVKIGALQAQEPLLGDWPFDVSQVEVCVLGGIISPVSLSPTDWEAAFEKFNGLQCLRMLNLPADLVTPILDMLAKTTTCTENHDKLELEVCRNLTTLEIFDIRAVDTERRVGDSLFQAILTRSRFGQLKEVDIVNVAGFDKTGLMVRLMDSNIYIRGVDEVG